MSRSILLGLLITSILFSSAQKGGEFGKSAKSNAVRKDSVQAQQKLYVGFKVCPLMSLANFRKYVRINEQAPSQDEANQEVPEGGFVGGFEFAYYGKHVGFETGVSYATYADKWLSWDGPGNINLEVDFERFHNIEIPFLFNVYSKPARVRFIGSFGICGDLTLLHTGVDVDEHTVSIFKKSTWGAYSDPFITDFLDGGVQAQTGVEIAINSKVLLRISPAVSITLFTHFYVNGGINIEILFPVGGKKG